MERDVTGGEDESRQVSGASFTVWRAVLGLALAVEATRYLTRGWVEAHLVAPPFHFHYPGLEWVAPLPEAWMRLWMIVLAVLGLGIVWGRFTRHLAALSLLGWAYVFTIDRALYLNHHYLTAILLVLLALTPPVRMRGTIDRFWPWLMRALLASIYVWAGISKLDPDWMQGATLSISLGGLVHLPLIGPLLVLPASLAAMCWGLIAIELGAPALLCWRRTRPWAMAALALFHGGTMVFYEIGIFPWVCLGLLSLWMTPEWPLRLRGLLTGRPRGAGAEAANTDGDVAAGAATRAGSSGWSKRVAVLVVGLQAAVPLRAVAHDGRHSWTGVGTFLSWRLLSAQKTGWCRFQVEEVESGVRREVSPLQGLTVWQASKMARHPDMQISYARHLARRAREEGLGPVRVFVYTGVSLNGRPPSPLIDPVRNLVPEWTDETALAVDVVDLVMPLREPAPAVPWRAPQGWWEANMWGEPLLLQGLRGALSSGDEVSARETLELLALVEDASPTARASAALAWARLGERARAGAILGQTERAWAHRDPDRTCEAMRGLEASARERYPELAIAALDLCLAVRDDPEALRRRADLAIAQGDVSTSHALLQRLVAADPDALEPTLKLVELLAVYMRQGDEARRLLDVASARHPHEPRIDEVRTIVDGVR